MPPKKKVPKSRSAGARVEAASVVANYISNTSGVLMTLHGSVRVFDSKIHVQNDNGSVSVDLSLELTRALYEELGRALRLGLPAGEQFMETMETHVDAAKREIEEEDAIAEKARHTPEYEAKVAENRRRSNLPSEHPQHIHGMMCDGQDGASSYCVRLRRKLFGDRR